MRHEGIGLGLNNSLLECMDQFNECGPAGIDSAKSKNSQSPSTMKNQESADKSSPQAPAYDDASVVVAATQIMKEEEEQ